jgi:hypothetical protein
MLNHLKCGLLGGPVVFSLETTIRYWNLVYISRLSVVPLGGDSAGRLERPRLVLARLLGGVMIEPTVVSEPTDRWKIIDFRRERLEQVTGTLPISSAWEAEVLPLNYAR